MCSRFYHGQARVKISRSLREWQIWRVRHTAHRDFEFFLKGRSELCGIEELLRLIQPLPFLLVRLKPEMDNDSPEIFVVFFDALI